MSELSFLIELLLNHDLPKATKDLIAGRIKEVEQKLQPAKPVFIATETQVGYNLPRPTQQAPSTLAAMARHGDLPPEAFIPPPVEPTPVAVIAQTPATAAALNQRNQLIQDALAGNGKMKNRQFKG